MGAHVHTHDSHSLGAPSKGQEAFPCHTTELKHNRMVRGPPLLRGLWATELFNSSSIPIKLIALKPWTLTFHWDSAAKFRTFHKAKV